MISRPAGQSGFVLGAVLLILASQIVLAVLLFGTAAVDRDPDAELRALPYARRRRLAGGPRDRGGPIVAMRAHQRSLSSLQAASERSLTDTRGSVDL